MKLKLFIVADIHSPDYFHMPKLNPDHFDLILTLGDIDPGTLEYIWEMSRGIPAYGVLGNHDPREVIGLNNLHGKSVSVAGVRIGGCGGAPRYQSAPNHYSEWQIAWLMYRMPPVDIFISHCPPRAASPDEDRIHRGFKAFDHYLYRKKPKYWLHGHLGKRYQTLIGSTTVSGVNECQTMTIEI